MALLFGMCALLLGMFGILRAQQNVPRYRPSYWLSALAITLGITMMLGYEIQQNGDKHYHGGGRIEAMKVVWVNNWFAVGLTVLATIVVMTVLGRILRHLRGPKPVPETTPVHD